MVRKKIKRKHNFNTRLILIATAILSWVSLINIVIFVSPKRWEEIYFAPFFITLTLSIGLTIKIFTKKTIFALVIPVSISSVLILRILNYKEWYYPLLILGLTITLIYFFTLPEENAKLQKNNSINKINDLNPKNGSNIQKNPRSEA